MSSRRLRWSLIAFVLLVAGLLGTNLGFGNRPILGLDLQGGVSVILQSTDEASADDLLVVQDLIRDELETLGIAEPDVRVEGDNIVVDLPGVKDQAQALEAVDVAGIVSLRPVLACQVGVTPSDIDEDALLGLRLSSLPTGCKRALWDLLAEPVKCSNVEARKRRSINSRISGLSPSTFVQIASRCGTRSLQSVTQVPKHARHVN